MSARPEPLNPAEQADLGRVAGTMRAAGMLWKEIAADLGLCERQLRRCIRMSENSSGMSDRGDCIAA